MKLLIPALFFVGLLASGCASTPRRGNVAMKINDQEAHVCMGDKEVQPGDKVVLYKNQCGPKTTRYKTHADAGRVECRFEELGEGEITETLNEHYSVMKVAPGVLFEEGTLVQKR